MNVFSKKDNDGGTTSHRSDRSVEEEKLMKQTWTFVNPVKSAKILEILLSNDQTSIMLRIPVIFKLEIASPSRKSYYSHENLKVLLTKETAEKSIVKSKVSNLNKNLRLSKARYVRIFFTKRKAAC